MEWSLNLNCVYTMDHHQTQMPVFLPMMHQRHHLNHHRQDHQDAPVLDLCVRKRPLTPDFHPYDSSKRSDRSSPKSDVSDVSSTEANAQVSSSRQRGSRPFKAYPKDPLSLALLGTTRDLLGKDSVEAYAEFREKMMARVQAGGGATNKNMRRSQNANALNSDPGYWEKRKKNNEAAKRSRDARRAKEDEIAIRCAFLEQENIQLKFRLAAMENERERLQSIVYR
ncbi:unnamed protein product [Phyllotreta striolata]|uniref:BZIP domain-containing protein n=1 Tax=Phyllotreta striolata TaxID=444603 RepID=A0A9N9TNH7_PHYSR|nr:unnamed protein product [Phyllotreta striolata]